MKDLDKFLNEFEDELDNRDKIEDKKSNLFDDIIKNLISELNKNSKNNQIVILKVDKFNDITTTIGDYIHSHTLSEVKELLNVDKCIKLLGGKNKISQKLNIFDCVVTNLYGVYTIDSFINDMVDEKKKKFLSPRSIFGKSSQVRPQVIEPSGQTLYRSDYPELWNFEFGSDDSYPSLPSWRINTPKETPSIPKGVLPWVPTSLEFSGENPWDSDGLLRKFSELMRIQWEKDEEYRERIRKFYE